MRASRIGWMTAVALTLLLGSAAAQGDSTASLRARFDRETDAVRKAKLMPQLGEAQFREIRDKVRAGQFPEALAVLAQYRAEVETCEEGLKALGVNAEKHPNGFKELEISVRESLRRLNELVHSMPSDEQEPFLEIYRALIDVDQWLVQQLFPGRS